MGGVDCDAVTIARSWATTGGLDLAASMQRAASSLSLAPGPLDVVAIGKAAPEMARDALSGLGREVQRALVVTDEPAYVAGATVLLGDHPVPTARSLAAGEALLDFLAHGTDAATTLFLVSGGASSLCVAPQSPVTEDDLHELWTRALAAGFNITELNIVRAAASRISGGRVLRHVRSAHSASMVMVDNVISGASWVASGLTFEHQLDTGELESLWSKLELAPTTLQRVRDGARARANAMRSPPLTRHANVVVAEPDELINVTRVAARRLGYRVVSLGSRVVGGVDEVAATMARALRAAPGQGPTCVIGVGEVSVRVRGSGRGGRCQALTWAMARELAGLEGASFAAVATDGRDHVEGVAGAWCDSGTLERAKSLDLRHEVISKSCDTNRALGELDQLIAGVRTGWNLCDLYVACGR